MILNIKVFPTFCALISIFLLYSEKTFGDTFFIYCPSGSRNISSQLFSFEMKNHQISDYDFRKPTVVRVREDFVYFIEEDLYSGSSGIYYDVSTFDLKKNKLIHSYVQIYNKENYERRKAEAKMNRHSILHPDQYPKRYNPSLLEVIPYNLKKNEKAFAFDKSFWECRRITRLEYILRIPIEILFAIVSAV